MKLTGILKLKKSVLLSVVVASLGLSVINAEGFGVSLSEYDEYEQPEFSSYESEEGIENDDLCKFRSLAERGSVFYTARSYNARDRENGQRIFDDILEEISRINEGNSLSNR